MKKRRHGWRRRGFVRERVRGLECAREWRRRGFVRERVRGLVLTLFVLTFFVLSTLCYAQSGEPFLVPRTVFVGDIATLVVPLPPSASDSGDIVITAKDHNYSIEDIDIHRVVLERRVSGNRLLLEFTAFATGKLEMPNIEIAGESFNGLTAEISSLLDTSRAPHLSPAAPTLAIPGTGTMLYGSMAGIVFFILISIWIFFRGKKVFANLYEKWKRWNLFVYMKRSEKNLARLLLKGGDEREILDKLSDEFRAFLTIYTGSNCRSMTARELSADTEQFDARFLGKFFRRCDDLRFCGAKPETEAVSDLLYDLRNFIAEAEKKEKAA